MAEGRMNLAALQQRDPYITEILDTASQVALYSFNSKSSKWETTSIEGSLFIYKRSATPVTGFMILNRLGLKNLIEPISKDLEFQQQDPFLLYRNGKSIYGVWFYDKDECKRLGTKLNNYVQEILTEQEKKQTTSTSSMVGGATAAQHSGSMTAGIVPTSGVDIMQMLSKAQMEYDTGSKKSEPKPMIDNPNASATKATNIIRPQPLKIPDSDTNIQDDVAGSVTPGTGNISLDQLFRTASLQQATGPQQSVTPQPTHSDSYFSASREQMTKRQTSVTLPPKQTLLETKPTSESESLPPLLKHIMSTGSMVEDIERQHIQGAGDSAGDDLKHMSSGLTPVIPDLTQPPPNHPAYRGPSPQTQIKQARKSPLDTKTSDTGRPKSRTKVGTSGVVDKGPVSSGVVGPMDVTKIISGNVLTAIGGSVPSQPGNAQKLSPEAGTFGKHLLAPKPESSIGSRQTVDPSPVLTSSLLTPADLLQSASTLSSTTVSTTLSTVSTLQDKASNPNLATAAASLSTELLSPMAFLTSTARKTPPVLSTSSEKSAVCEEKTDKEMSVLPVAALTKEQLQQSLLYLLKNDSNFITTIHEAYLKSLYELSGQKS